jgi:hypothetical protein
MTGTRGEETKGGASKDVGESKKKREEKRKR